MCLLSLILEQQRQSSNVTGVPSESKMFSLYSCVPLRKGTHEIIHTYHRHNVYDTSKIHPLHCVSRLLLILFFQRLRLVVRWLPLLWKSPPPANGSRVTLLLSLFKQQSSLFNPFSSAAADSGRQSDDWTQLSASLFIHTCCVYGERTTMNFSVEPYVKCTMT